MEVICGRQVVFPCRLFSISLGWGQDQPEAQVVAPVDRYEPTVVGRPAVLRIAVPTAAAPHAVRA